jgi:hypothetical protein
MVKVRRYESGDRRVWDEFVEAAKTRLFFLRRDYLEYHSDRFIDHSLLIEDTGELVAILPANQTESVLSSHGGLTYGGLLLNSRARAVPVFEIFQHIRSYCQSNGISQVIYKPAPYIFHREPAQEDLYAIFRLGGKLFRRDISSVIRLDLRRRLSKGRKHMINRARKNQLMVEDSRDWKSFHDLLSTVLAKHRAVPVHSADELEYLYSRCPTNISLRIVRSDTETLAATLLFHFDEVTHTQYIGTSEQGKEVGALDLLLEECIQDSTRRGDKYFSFGISTEDQGRHLNSGLIAQKEGFGARGVVIDQYEISV